MPVQCFVVSILLVIANKERTSRLAPQDRMLRQGQWHSLRWRPKSSRTDEKLAPRAHPFKSPNENPLYVSPPTNTAQCPPYTSPYNWAPFHPQSIDLLARESNTTTIQWHVYHCITKILQHIIVLHYILRQLVYLTLAQDEVDLTTSNQLVNLTQKLAPIFRWMREWYLVRNELYSQTRCS